MAFWDFLRTYFPGCIQWFSGVQMTDGVPKRCPNCGQQFTGSTSPLPDDVMRVIERCNCPTCVAYRQARDLIRSLGPPAAKSAEPPIVVQCPACNAMIYLCVQPVRPAPGHALVCPQCTAAMVFQEGMVPTVYDAQQVATLPDPIRGQILAVQRQFRLDRIGEQFDVRMAALAQCVKTDRERPKERKRERTAGHG